MATTTEQQQYQFFAFISYNSKDAKWARRLQKKLESYRMPATICTEHGWDSHRPMKPIFFAETDIQPGPLDAELKRRLEASRYLIVICSPRSARSKWVGKEIQHFIQLGRAEQMHFFIVDGVPYSGDPETECFNPAIKDSGLPEILGVNIHEKVSRWAFVNKERAYVQLISKMLDVEFDSIWQRHKRQLRMQLALLAVAVVGVLAALGVTWYQNQPFSAAVGLEEQTVHNDQLPPLKDAVVTLTLANETKTDTIRTMDGEAVIRNIPHRFLGQEVKVTLRCKDFLPVDTVMVLGPRQRIGISRDEAAYGTIQFTLWNPSAERPVPHTDISVGGLPARSDAEGRVRLHVPLDRQRRVYPLRSSVRLQDAEVAVPHTESTIICTE